VILVVAGPKDGEEPRGESPPTDSDPFSEASLAKISSTCQTDSPQNANRRFKLRKRSQLFICSPN